jgi:hypothetical protein
MDVSYTYASKLKDLVKVSMTSVMGLNFNYVYLDLTFCVT